jgi:excisionase family DNA binding protein
MTRTEARILAEELYKLMRKDVKMFVEATVVKCSDEWVGVGEAAEILGCSTGTLYNNISNIPHTKNGRLLRFKKSALIKYLER